MSDANEERLLTELLGELARADAGLGVPDDLEARVVARWDEQSRLRGSRREGGRALVYAALAAALLMALAVSLRHRDRSPAFDRPPARTEFRDAPTHEVTLEREPIATPPPSERSLRPVASPPASYRSRASREHSTPQQIVDFIPLGPMAPAGLSGSFQIVPVRINNTPAHLVLGEDGIAQGILWRSK